jgi:hypothetical protein
MQRSPAFTYVHAACMLAFTAVHPIPHAMANPLLLPLLNWARTLRYPTLFKLTVALFAFSMLLPPGVDPIPFLDEILFGLGTLLFANWKRRKDPEMPAKAPLDGDASR